MITITKSSPSIEITRLLEREKNKISGTYRHDIIIDKVKEDFYSKCYLCESNDLQAINIEHFIPHKENLDLKFDWNNLYYACYHCNNTKLSKYDNILDPLTDDVENLISYKFQAFHQSQPVEIKANTSHKLYLDNKSRIDSTVNLLNDIYNGQNTHIKHLESVSIRKSLKKEIQNFQQDIEEYEDALLYQDKDSLKNALKSIKNHLHKASQFTAFKRDLIKSIPELNNLFGQFID